MALTVYKDASCQKKKKRMELNLIWTQPPTRSLAFKIHLTEQMSKARFER